MLKGRLLLTKLIKTGENNIIDADDWLGWGWELIEQKRIRHGGGLMFFVVT